MILTGILDLPIREDDFYDTLYENAAKLQQAGVRFCISSGDSGANVRNLPFYAGMAAAFGLPKTEALKAVTLYPAQIMNVADRLGSIEVGKMANLVVTDGDLLETTNTRAPSFHRRPAGSVEQPAHGSERRIQESKVNRCIAESPTGVCILICESLLHEKTPRNKSFCPSLSQLSRFGCFVETSNDSRRRISLFKQHLFIHVRHIAILFWCATVFLQPPIPKPSCCVFLISTATAWYSLTPAIFGPRRPPAVRRFA